MESRNLIVKAYEIATGKGFNQSRWSEEAGRAINGQTVSRILKKGDCRMSTFLSLLRAVGCELEIKENEDGNAGTEN